MQLNRALELKEKLEDESTDANAAAELIKRAVTPKIDDTDPNRVNDERWTFQGDANEFIAKHKDNKKEFFKILNLRIEDL